ncbi:MAG TPA: outer membrane beta-barrel protein [Microvirga sp.]|jgi:opacity protein-like surface antigen|nr:outer membrane beta-barrel protein [Microvirga sp.]
MVRAGWAGIAAALFGGTALAADLPQRAAPVVPVLVAPAVQPWAGFYGGSGIGYMWSRVSVREAAASGSYDLDGTTGFRLIGHDWQFGQVVAGLQAEIGFHETKGRLAPGPTTGAIGDQLWTAGVRGRLGYAFGSVLPYVAVGVATTELHQHSAVLFADGDLRYHTGFTAAAGVDITWARWLTTRLEYEYGDYGSANHFHDGVNHRVDLETHAIKAAIIVREVPGKLAGGTLTPGRGGSYVGLEGNYALTDVTFRRPAGTRTNLEPDGFEAGIFGGYDLSFGNWFIGYDSRVSLSDVTGRGTGPAGPIAVDMLWSGSTRGRLGGTFGAFSPYIAAGFTLAQLEVLSVGTGLRDVEMAYGGTGAIGLDYAVTDRWFARAEYAYSRYAQVKPLVDLAVNRLDMDRHDIRFGIGYRLSD